MSVTQQKLKECLLRSVDRSRQVVSSLARVYLAAATAHLSPPTGQYRQLHMRLNISKIHTDDV